MSNLSENALPKPTKETLQMILAEPLAKLTGFLDNQVNDFEEQIRFLVEYCLENSGKRIRPSLVFLTGNLDDKVVLNNLVKVSAVVEMVHMATLVHDDILDGADKRRGQPTISARFGHHTAVLLGDALFSHALHMASQFDTIEVCRCVSRSTRRVCSGEILQTFRRGDWKLEMGDYLEMLDMKTGELFSISTYLGGLLSGYSKSTCDTLRRFGSELGIAYQAYDDVTDFLGDEVEIGKTLGTDLLTGKATLPLILLFQKRNELLTEQMNEALLNGDELAVRGLLIENNIFEVGITFVSDLWNQAMNTLAQLPDDFGAKQNLMEMSQVLRAKLTDLENGQLSTK